MSNKKRILLIHYGIYCQARWGRTFPLAAALAALGHDVTLLTNSAAPQWGALWRREEKDGVMILAFRDIIPMMFLRKGFGFLSFWGRLLWCATHRYDLVYADCPEMLSAGWPAVVNRFLFGSRFLAEWGDKLGRGGYYEMKPWFFKFFYGWYYLWAEFHFRKTADLVITLSTPMREYAIERGIGADKLIVVPGGALCAKLHDMPADKSGHPELAPYITIGYIGMDSGELQDLLPLLDVMKQPEFRNRFRLVAYGHRIAPELLERYGIGDLIFECGWVNYYRDPSPLRLADLFLLMKSADVGLSAAGWPNKLGDYLALGKAVMVTPYGDVGEFVRENPAGFIPFSPESESIAATLRKLAAGEFDLARMGRESRKVAEDKISWEARAAALPAFFDQEVKQR